MPVVLDLHDMAMAIGKVATIELIKIRMKKQAERIRLKKSTTNNMSGLQTVEEDETDPTLVTNFTLGVDSNLGGAALGAASLLIGGLGSKPQPNVGAFKNAAMLL
jgi:uncharacterized secreted protein with C-terminal beta-propeller domain